jgi:hypothetical protein
MHDESSRGERAAGVVYHLSCRDGDTLLVSIGPHKAVFSDPQAPLTDTTNRDRWQLPLPSAGDGGNPGAKTVAGQDPSKVIAPARSKSPQTEAPNTGGSK